MHMLLLLVMMQLSMLMLLRGCYTVVVVSLVHALQMHSDGADQRVLQGVKKETESIRGERGKN